MLYVSILESFLQVYRKKDIASIPCPLPATAAVARQHLARKHQNA